jgi:hypothetical protein
MLLISSGGNGDGTSGGGSGSVTVWYGSAQNVPDILYVQIGGGGTGINTAITGRFSSGNVQLLRASSPSGSTAGAATTAGVFAASGFYQSIAGQDGINTNQIASTTTFLSGGGAGNSTQVSNYGYSYNNGAQSTTNGSFQMQPIIVGSCGMGAGRGGIGCGGGITSGVGGPGFVLIASW